MVESWSGVSAFLPDWAFNIDLDRVGHSAPVTPDLLDAIANGCDPQEEDTGDGEYVDEAGRIWK